MILNLAVTLSLVFQISAQAACDLQALTALAQKLLGRPIAEEPVFKKYYESGKAGGWKDLIEQANAQVDKRVSLGGNSYNTFSTALPDGTPVVTKVFPSSSMQDHRKVIEQLERWNTEGIGPRLIGVSVLPGLKSNERQLFVVMENLLASRNDLGKKIAGGNGNELSALRRESEASRKWLMERMLGILETHPDPHPLNVVFRVTKLDPAASLPKEGTFYQEGGKIYQAFLVDPSGEEGDPNYPLFNKPINQTPDLLLQYNKEWKRKYFQRELGF